jgi:hypothetical protein
MSQVVDQSTDEEIGLMDEAAVARAYTRYDVCMGGLPPESVEPSIEHLTAVSYLVFIARVVPYLDFAVFGPFAIRMLRKIRMAGLVLGPSGNLTQAELYGPNCIDQWIACSLVARTALIMLSIVQPSGYDLYHDLIRNYAARFGPLCWPLLYQADTRARRELAERIYRRLDREGKFLVSGIAVRMPWDLVYRAMVDEYSFWRREVEDPSILVITRSNAAGRMVEGDAPVARTSAEHIAPSDNLAGSGTPSVPSGGSPRKRQKHAKVNHPARDNAGGYTTSRSMLNLCPPWNAGTCTHLEKDCPQGLKHQCSKCLHNSHGLSNHEDRPSGKGPKGGKPKGKGKGK